MFITIPTGVNYMTRRYPVVTFTIMGLNTLLYLVSLVLFFSSGDSGLLEEKNDWLIDNLGLIPAESVWYTYFTSLFVHAGFWHLLGNMMYLFLFGCCVEDLIGRWQFAVFYIIGGVASDFGHILASAGNFDSILPLVGASGAISACMGGFVLLLHGNKIDFKYFAFLFFRFFSGEFSLPAWLVISFWFLKDLAFAILAANSEGGGGVAFAAHVGGFAGGMILIGLWKLLNKDGRLDPLKDQDLENQGSAQGPGSDATIYVLENNVQSGPFTRQQLSEMQSLGSFSADTLFWQDGMSDWRSIDEFGQ